MDVTELEKIDWPTLFGNVEDLGGLAWEESRPGFWTAPYEQGKIAIAAVCPTDLQWFASIVGAYLPASTMAQLSFTMHDALAERLRVAGWTVGCAGPACGYLWPCPTREMKDFMGQPNGGELHTPIGLERTVKA